MIDFMINLYKRQIIVMKFLIVLLILISNFGQGSYILNLT